VVVVIMKVNGNDVMKTECKAVVTYCREWSAVPGGSCVKS
jgi:hypothetical protein